MSLYVKAASAALMAISLGSSYIYGNHVGKASVQALWDAETNQRKGAQAVVSANDKTAEMKHVLDSKGISDALLKVKQEQNSALLASNSELASRLRNSEARADSYRKQAEAGTSECRSLADHAAELDHSLEEGRGLVIELRDNIILKDQQLILLGKQIKADRELLGE